MRMVLIFIGGSFCQAARAARRRGRVAVRVIKTNATIEMR
jgi:hypothetical protein